MNDVMLNLIVIGFLGIIGLVFFLFYWQRKKQKDAEFMQMANAKGWQVEKVHEPLRSGYKLSGRYTLGTWTMELLATASPRELGPGSSEVSHTTRWWSSDVCLPNRALVVGPIRTPSDAQMLASLNGTMLQMGLRALLGENASWAVDLKPIPCGSEGFQKAYLCLAHERRDVEKMLQADIEKHLLALSPDHKPVVKFFADGLEVTILNQQVLDRATLEKVVALGTALAETWARG